ncbi:hypothetical protein ACTMSW_08220 [Micromonospora sp. BQ11]|uniref:hypothetical protein n=1 Tax=Micromonospora sp. BQ11 TaxID=3452212 RepID=UPI003F8A03C5
MRDPRVIEGEVDAVRIEDDRLSGVCLRSGAVVACQALVVAPRFVARAEVLESLGFVVGAGLTEMAVDGHSIGTYVTAEPTGATTVPGVWVAGNVVDPRARVISSAAAGLTAAGAINAALVAEDTRRAVADRRVAQENPRGTDRSGSSPRADQDLATRMRDARGDGL